MSRISRRNVILNLTMVHPHSNLLHCQLPFNLQNSSQEPSQLRCLLWKPQDFIEIQEPCKLFWWKKGCCLLLMTIRHQTSRTDFKNHSHHQQTQVSGTTPPSSFCNRAHFKCGTSLKSHYSDDGEFIRCIQLHMMH